MGNERKQHRKEKRNQKTEEVNFDFKCLASNQVVGGSESLRVRQINQSLMALLKIEFSN